MKTEDLDLTFDSEAVEEIARIAETVNQRTENIGARRLYTIMEKLLDEISFDAPERTGEAIIINKDYVREKLQDVVKDEDLSRYIL
jgi:ATP-dependent HslUV protease ATP-binding subunit HslU